MEYTVILNILLPFFIILIQVSLGIHVLIQDFKNRINLSFASFCFSLSFWTFCVFMLQKATEISEAIFWGRYIFVGPILLIYFFLYFTFVFPKKIVLQSRYYKFLLFIPTLLCLIMVPGPWILKSAVLLPGGPSPFFGIGYPFFAAYFLFYFLYGILNLFKKLKVSTGNEKNQILYLLIGLFLTLLIGTITNLVLPAFGEARFINLGPLFTLFLVGFTTYAIVKHRLMSIDVVIQKGFVYTLASVFIIATYALAVFLSEQLLRTAFGYTSFFATAFLVFVIAATFQPFLRLAQNLADRIFLRHRYDYQKTLRKVSREILRKIRLNELADLIILSFVEVMRVSEISFLILDKENNNYKSVDSTHGRYKKFSLSANGDLVKCLLATKRILAVDELEQEIYRQEAEGGEGRVLEEIKPWGFKLWIPVILREELFAIIALGDKLSGDIFSVEDLRLLNTLANQTALALENVRLYQEVLEIKNYNQEVLHSLVYGVLTTDEKGIIKTCNPAMEKIIGMRTNEVVGQPYQELFSEKNPLNISIANTLKNKCFFNFEASVINKKRGLVPIMINTTLLGSAQKKTGVLLAVRDLTEIKELENRARQADKLKALGIMSAGMAHEIKNPLSSLRILSQLLPIKYKDKEFRKKLIEIVPNEVSRIDRIVESLLRFARTTRMKFVAVNINDYLDEILKEYLNQAEENKVEIVKNYAELPDIMLDQDQLIQVFSNLFLNGIQAMPEGGTLTITTKIGKQVENFIQGITIEVSDTGHGISEEDIKHLFDPFFTTKHEGTGLGLTIAHSIIEAHQGRIEVSSKPGEGTTFQIYLPVHQ